MAKKSGLKVDRKYTTPGNPYNNIAWEKRSSKITNPDGSVVFEMNDVCYVNVCPFWRSCHITTNSTLWIILWKIVSTCEHALLFTA